MGLDYGEQLRRHAAATPDALAMIDFGREVTYRELNARVNRLANGLAAAGVRRGDRVAGVVDNGGVPYETMLACAKAGFVWVPLDFRLSTEDRAAILADCGASAAVVDGPYLESVEAIRERLPSVRLWLSTEPGERPGFASYHALADGASEDEPGIDVPDTDLLCILYTSGTTGRAKGVTITHGQTLLNSASAVIVCDIGPDTRYLVSYPHNSAGTVNHVWGPTLLMGGAVVIDQVKQFDAERYLTLVERHRVTHGQLVPTMLFRLLDYPDIGRFDISSLQTLGYASAPIPAHRVRQASEVFGDILVQLYGMTETSSHVTILSKRDHRDAMQGDERLLSSCGRAVWGAEIKLVDDSGAEVGPNELGEIVLRGPWITSGYWNDPERTAEAIRDGWLYSGDVGRMDERGYLYIVDRKKDIIITGGANVASTEVEAAVYDHPAVLEAAVIGVPDDQWGERVHAVVSLRPGSTVTEDELIAHCRERLAGFKCPKSVEIREELPRTSTGKLAKAELRRAHQASRQTGVS